MKKKKFFSCKKRKHTADSALTTCCFFMANMMHDKKLKQNRFHSPNQEFENHHFVCLKSIHAGLPTYLLYKYRLSSCGKFKLYLYIDSSIRFKLRYYVNSFYYLHICIIIMLLIIREKPLHVHI